MIRILELRKRVVVRGDLDSLVVDLDLFQRFQVVVDQHSLASHEGHLANLVGIEPLLWMVAKAPPAKSSVRLVMSSILGLNVRLALTMDRNGPFVQEVKNNRYS